MGLSFYTNVARYGNNILWRGYENGRAFSRKEKFEPTFYLPTKNPSEYRTLIGNRQIAPKIIPSMGEAKEFLEQYKDVSGFEIYGTSNYITQFIQQHYPKKIKFDVSLINIFSFDIETDSSVDAEGKSFGNVDTADKAIISISLKSSKKSTYHLLGMKDFDKTKTITGVPIDDISYEKFDTEAALLLRFIQLWKHDYPDVVTGWNVEYYDIMYIVTRIIRVLGEAKANELSPWGSLKKKTTEIFNRPQSTYEILGITIVDYLDAFKKFGYKYGTQENYKLDTIAHVVLGENKVDYSEYGSLNDLYEKNPQLFLDYSLKDTYLIQRLEDETALLSLVLAVAYKGGVNFSEAFGTVGIWESTIYRKLCEKNLVPNIKNSHERDNGDLVGGYVKDPVVGSHPWIVSFDLNSLYPKLMSQYNMSPETYMPNIRVDVTQDMVLEGKFKNSNKEYSVCANGVCFRNDVRGIIPEIIEEYYAERKAVKDEMLRIEQLEENETDPELKEKYKKEMVQLYNQQMTVKINLNSLYGGTGNKYFLYFIFDMAEAITTSGQLSVKYAQKSINNYMNTVLKTKNVDYVYYVDTDSCYVNFATLIEKVFGTVNITREQGEKFIDEVCKKKIVKVLDAGFEELADYMGAYCNDMGMKREKITDRSLFISKKRYILSVLNSEGVHYDTPELSVTGIESVRSSTPEICRTKMEELFRVILDGSEPKTQKFISDFKVQFFKLPAEEVAKISGTDDIEKYIDKQTLYKKGCPIHVRGCILYNDFLERKGLSSRYEKIRSGDKIKFVYLKTPNPVRENIISFMGSLPKEFGLETYINYETQFEKVFLDPVQKILTAIGWTSSKLDTLESFFN